MDHSNKPGHFAFAAFSNSRADRSTIEIYYAVNSLRTEYYLDNERL